MKLLLAVDLVLVLLALGAWLAVREDPRDNAVNDGLRGSTPPAGQVWPDLEGVAGIDPAFPGREALDGTATMLVATCAACRSGDIIGGYLGRLGSDDLPDGARVVVLTWSGDQDSWARRWRIDRARIELHSVLEGEATDHVRRDLGIGSVDGAEESGIAFLHDTRGRWRSTFAVGQLDAEDIAHDLEQLGRD